MKGLRESCFELSHKGQFRMLTGGRVEGREGGMQRMSRQREECEQDEGLRRQRCGGCGVEDAAAQAKPGR